MKFVSAGLFGCWLTIKGDTAHVTVIQTGLKRPTAIEPAGDVLWVGDRASDSAMSIPLPH